jgi:MFS family permease
MAATAIQADIPVASIWDREHAPLTIGVIMAITLMAIEGLAMATIAPVLSDDLHGDHVYGWIFSAYMLASIIGTVVGGQEVDRRSPAVVFGTALLLFTVGGVVAGLAPSIEVFLGGRALQGLSGGMVIATSYAIINTLYEDKLRPAILAAESTAYVLPSLIGPLAVGAVTESLSWRVVFLGILIFVIPVAALVLPRFRAIPPKDAPVRANTSRALPAVLLALATGIFLIGLEIDLIAAALIVVLAGLAAMVVLLRRLLPEGTFAIRPVLPAAIVVRATTFGTFLIAETFMVYALKDFGGASASEAGVLVSTGALTWVTGSWLQARVEGKPGIGQRSVRIAIGVASMVAGVGGVFGMILLFDDIWFVPAMFGWMLAGLGIGFGLTTAAAVALAESPEGEEGRVSSSMLLGDLVGASVGVGMGGVLLALGDGRGWSSPDSVTLALVPALIFLAISAVAALRLGGRP